MKFTFCLSILWALAAIVLTLTDLGWLTLLVVISFAFFGAGIPVGVASSLWPELNKEHLPRPALFVLLSIAAATSSSALAGQIFVWSSTWNPQLQLVYSCMMGLGLGAVADKYRASGSRALEHSTRSRAEL